MESGTYVSAERAVRCRRDAYEVPARAGRRPLRRTASQRSRGGDEQMSRPEAHCVITSALKFPNRGVEVPGWAAQTAGANLSIPEGDGNASGTRPRRRAGVARLRLAGCVKDHREEAREREHIRVKGHELGNNLGALEGGREHAWGGGIALEDDNDIPRCNGCATKTRIACRNIAPPPVCHTVAEAMRILRLS